LYNQIKAAEARPEAKADVLGNWKAGFIEDADELHLALKPMFATLINHWAQEEEVKAAIVNYAPGGETRLKNIMTDVESTLVKQFGALPPSRTSQQSAAARNLKA
jgi:hypothetical protein